MDLIQTSELLDKVLTKLYSDASEYNASVNYSCAHPPPLRPRLLRGICQFCPAWGPGICQPWGYSQASDMHVVSYQNITTLRILPEKQAYWLNYQGQEKIEEGCKDMFSILCMHFFIVYQARITWRNWELTGHESN